jgi:hypothetical protein
VKISFACLADHATVDAIGKLTISGVFDRIMANAFPVAHRSMFLVCRVQLEYGDSGKKIPIRLRILDEDNKMAAELTGEMQTAQAIPPGRFVGMNLILQLNDLIFPKPGRYKIELQPPKTAPTHVDFMVDQQ